MGRVEMLANAIQAIGSEADRLRNPELTAFLGFPGAKYSGELLVVGRAPNQWLDSWQASEGTNPARATEIAQNTVVDGSGCPMQLMYASGRYNPNRSAFWRSARHVLQHLSFSTEHDDWVSMLAWTNLYKIAPAIGVNPSIRLRSVQQEFCNNILRTELNEFVPRRILFMTGLDWVQPFQAALGLQLEETATDHVKATGRVEGAQQPVSVIVTTHPDRKPSGWLAELLAVVERKWA